ncbi:MAG: hypothetical protein PF541_06580, partial [Prolixibacteraceae bacterium]|nr:hypothetical protein [Prolixibacteraceae bacterium]
MKKIITISILALFAVACSQTTPEAQEKKAEALKLRISKMEKKLKEIQNPANTIEVEKIYNVKVKPLQIETI